jgi:mono/diheme cytochrome c family protein
LNTTQQDCTRDSRPGLGWVIFVAASLVFAGVLGCEVRQASFPPNTLFAKKMGLAATPVEFKDEDVQRQMQDVSDILQMFFGTPGDPGVPAIDGLDTAPLFDIASLRAAAGADGTAHNKAGGLYRSLCAHCHGIGGDGAGPSAVALHPYPRDFRAGIFKYKSTPSTVPPTDDDLLRVLLNGIPGAAMPAYGWLSEDERTALVQYVRYLSVRGQFERSLIMETALTLDEDERLLEPEWAKRRKDAYQEQLEILTDFLQRAIRASLDAEEQITSIPSPPDDWGAAESVLRGRQLFFTAVASCSTCHGELALGDGQTNGYDQWTQDLEPTIEATLAENLDLGALPPRHIHPRNLRRGEFRGGRRPVDLYRRIKNGIAGTPMPSASTQLRSNDIWDLVAYIRQLPFEQVGD